MRITKTYVLDSIGDIVKIATTLSGSWFRGHARVQKELVPKLLREKYVVDYANRELSLIEAFKRVAPALDSNVPGQDDSIAWLFLMQHHGVSTRLLDWTKSALIALYFIVIEHKTEDGELWGMYPYNLNKLSGIGMPLRNNSILNYYVEEPLEDPKMLQSLYNLPQIPDKPIAIEPQMNFPRIMAQLSKFTIHPISNQAKLISTLLTDEKDLVRYIVPSESKSKLRSDLATLGITHTALFPSLDALGRDIIYDHRVVAYSPPNPPKCKGPWVKPTQ